MTAPVNDGEWRQYRRSQIATLRPYVPGETLDPRVSISAADVEAGSPKPGDMIARNPKNHDDQWLVAAQYFADNFEPVDAAPPRPEQDVREALLDATAHLVGAASAYRKYAHRHRSVGRGQADPFYTTRVEDFAKAAERAQKAVVDLLPDDGSCVRCGAVLRNASGLCATCLDEDAEREGTAPDPALSAMPAPTAPSHYCTKCGTMTIPGGRCDCTGMEGVEPNIVPAPAAPDETEAKMRNHTLSPKELLKQPGVAGCADLAISLAKETEALRRQVEILSDAVIPPYPDEDCDGTVTSRAAYAAWVRERERADAAEARNKALEARLREARDWINEADWDRRSGSDFIARVDALLANNGGADADGA